VRDGPAKAHRLGELLVDVDRVEVPAGAGVHPQHHLVELDRKAGDLVADVDLVI